MKLKAGIMTKRDVTSRATLGSDQTNIMVKGTQAFKQRNKLFEFDALM